ncbi:MAG: WD40 repeat domain-containing protein [Myxococcota bacterium]
MSEDSDRPRSARSRATELSRASSPFDAGPLHDSKLTSIRTLEDDRLLTTSWDGSYGIWNRHTGDLHRRVSLGFEQVDLLALEAERTKAVFGVQRGFEVLDVYTAEPLDDFGSQRIASIAPSPTHAAAFHPDGDLLFTGAQDKYLRVWDLASGSLIEAMRGHRRSISNIDVSIDSRIVSAALDGEVRVWDLRKGHCITDRWLSQHPITALEPLGSGQVYALGNSQGEVMIWDAADDEVTGQWHAHVGSIHDITALADPYLATVAADGELRIWSADDGELAGWYDAGQALHACIVDGDRIYIATDDGRLIQLDWPPEDL